MSETTDAPETQATDRLAARAEPCGTYPWRKDVSPGRFEADAFRLLADTAYDQSARVFQLSPEARANPCGCWRYAPLDAYFHCPSCDAEWLPEGRP